MLFFLICPKVSIIPNRMAESLMETFLSPLIFSQFSGTGNTPQTTDALKSIPVLSLYSIFRSLVVILSHLRNLV